MINNNKIMPNHIKCAKYTKIYNDSNTRVMLHSWSVLANSYHNEKFELYILFIKFT